MGELINGKTPEEIKRWLRWATYRCVQTEDRCATCEYQKDCGEYCGSDTYKEALALIERLEATQPKWISVEERLPEKDGEYLVLKVHNYRKDDGYMAQEVALFLRTRDPEWVVGNLCEVTHWMPLPEPPKEGWHGVQTGGC